MHRMVTTYSSWIWENEDDGFPLTDDGYYQFGWGELSCYKDDACTIRWDDAEMNDRRDAAMIDLELDEFDIEDGLNLAMKAADFIEYNGFVNDGSSDWFSTEPDIIDYRTGKYRELNLHFVDEDWTPEEIQAVYDELDYRAAMDSIKRTDAETYWKSVKAVV